VNEHILDRIEFPKVCQSLAERASSARGKRAAAALRPQSDRGSIEASLEAVRQMRQLQIAGHDPGPIEVGDIDPLLARLRLEGDLLQPDELLALKSFLSVSTRVRRTLGRPEFVSAYPAPHALAVRFGDFHPLVNRIDEVFEPSGEFLDTASPTLQRIRRNLRNSRVEAGESLAGLARRVSAHPEETFVTLREGRYVLAIRGADRGSLQGIVHGHSGSGQTVFLEPMQAIERNNAISELESEEREERIEILRELNRKIREVGPAIVDSYEVSEELDLLRARALLAGDLRAGVPALNDGEKLRLVGVRHPILAEAEAHGGPRVVPLDLELSGSGRTLVLSGPNMGGKTVALKTVGLTVAMAQAGLLVPAADGTDLPVVDGIFVDLGDEQSIELETSTFAGHLRNVGLAWEEATSRSLVLLDELGGGTDPDEGTALGRAVLELLTDRGCFMLVTTHLSGLKIVAHEHARMTNAAMEFDPGTQQPTYRLQPGAPGRSRAFELARRMLPAGGLLERAEGYRSRMTAELDELLADLERRRIALDEEIARVRGLEEELRRASARRDLQAEKLRTRIQSIREARLESTGATLREAENLLAEARRIRSGLERAERAKTKVEAEELKSVEDSVASARTKVRNPRDPRLSPLRASEAEPGVPAYSRDLKTLVRIESSPDAAEKVWISHGTLRFHVPVASLSHPPETPPPGPVFRPRSAVRGPAEPASVEREIDVRGLTAEEGLERVERYIDRASIAGVPEVRIIHGKGTGTLKRVIEDLLRDSTLVESYRIGEPREGGWGATIVRLRSAQVGD
jgi:DNA mismatch repair protein MutS2